MEAFDRIIREGPFESIVVRPASLKDTIGPAVGMYAATEDSGPALFPISRADVALFLADNLTKMTWVKRGVQLYAAGAGSLLCSCTTSSVAVAR